MNKIFHLLMVLTMGVAVSTQTGYGQIYEYTSGHGDIGVGYLEDLQQFEPHWHLDGAGEFEPDGAVAVIHSQRSAPTGAMEALGVNAGTIIWNAGSAGYQPNLGFATEELSESDWNGNITITLSNWSGPGEFALYTTNFTGTTITDVVFSTYDPDSTYANNSFEIFVPDHLHFNFGFTQAGYYELEFTWTGDHVQDGVISTSATYGFNVVPEPSTYALFTLGAMGFFLVRFRQKMR